MLDRVLPGRKNMDPIVFAFADAGAYLVQSPDQVYVGDNFVVLLNGIPGGKRIYPPPLLITEVFSFQKNEFEYFLLPIEHMPVEILLRCNSPDCCFGQAIGQKAKVLLIGKTICHVVIEGRLDIATNKKFNIGDNVLKVVTQNALPASNTDMCAGEGLVIFREI